MRICDLTFAYTSTSGGIRTYLDQKRRYLREHTAHEHVLIVPGEDDAVYHDERTITYHIASPLIPGCEPYRFFCRPAALLDALTEAAPDVIELGSFFLEPWAALRYRDVLASKRCLVTGYFHTDLADAYFGTPVRETLRTHAGHWSATAAEWGAKLGDLVATGAASYFGSLFKRCDAMFAATPAQAARLASYGIADATVVPLGVDLECFHPRHRSSAVRQAHGVSESSALLAYAGRLDTEKHVHLLLDAFALLQVENPVLLLLGEGPQRAELETRAAALPGVRVLPFQRDSAELGRLLASADAYVTAGPHETFGLSVIEAQAAGLPVVGVDSGALRERVTPEIGCLGPVDDAAAMARNIETVLAAGPALRTAARRHVETMGYGWQNTFARLCAIYEAQRERPPRELAVAAQEPLNPWPCS